MGEGGWTSGAGGRGGRRRDSRGAPGGCGGGGGAGGDCSCRRCTCCPAGDGLCRAQAGAGGRGGCQTKKGTRWTSPARRSPVGERRIPGSARKSRVQMPRRRLGWLRPGLAVALRPGLRRHSQPRGRNRPRKQGRGRPSPSPEPFRSWRRRRGRSGGRRPKKKFFTRVKVFPIRTSLNGFRSQSSARAYINPQRL